MRILESGVFDEIRKTILPKQERKVQEDNIDSKNNLVAEENKRAFELVFNDKEFSIDLKKVERLKKEIEEGNYQIDSLVIAKEMLKSEQRGDSSMGLFTGESE